MSAPLAEHPSPQPLDPALVGRYTSAVTPVAADDWAGLRARTDAALALGRAAYTERSRAAWELAELCQWRLFHASWERPTDPGDVLVLDALIRAERAGRAPVDPPPFLPPDAFCDRLAADVVAAAHLDPSPVAAMCRATRADWRYLGHNLLAESRDFTRMIALAGLPLPHRYARRLHHNLYDEAGRGAWERAHYHLLADFLRPLGVPVPGFDVADTDDDALLDWTAPEVIAEINAHRRALWRPGPEGGLGALYVVEQLVPNDLRALVAALRALGMPEAQLAFFVEHIEGDEAHAEDWRAVLADFVGTAEAQRRVYEAAIDSARWFAAGWQGLVRGWSVWSRTGVPPHLPARELRAMASSASMAPVAALEAS